MIDISALGFPLINNKYGSFDHIEKNSISWADHFKLLDDLNCAKAYEQLNSGRVGHYTYCYSDNERTQIGTDLIGWLFMWDDVYPDGKFRREPEMLAQVSQKYMQVYSSGNSALQNSAFSHSLLDLKNRMSQFASEKWISRFKYTYRDYFDGCLKEVFYRSSNLIPTFEQYKDFRHQSIGGYPILDFMEIAHNSFVSDTVFESSLFQDFRKSSALILALTNDYFSLFKEELEQDSFNAIVCLRNEHQVDKSVAIAMYVDAHFQEVEKIRFLEEEIKIKWGAASPAARYCVSARTWMQGNLDWAMQTPRYQQSLPGEIIK